MTQICTNFKFEIFQCFIILQFSLILSLKIYQGRCGVRYHGLQDTDAIDGEFEQQVEIDEEFEKLFVPAIGDTRNATILHDFNVVLQSFVSRILYIVTVKRHLCHAIGKQRLSGVVQSGIYYHCNILSQLSASQFYAMICTLKSYLNHLQECLHMKIFYILLSWVFFALQTMQMFKVFLMCRT